MSNPFRKRQKEGSSFIRIVLHLHSDSNDLKFNEQIEGSCDSITLRRLCKQGWLKEALNVLTENFPFKSSNCASILWACADKRALSETKLLHTHMISQMGMNPKKHICTNHTHQHRWKVWEFGGGAPIVWQNAWMKCGFMDCYDSSLCQEWACWGGLEFVLSNAKNNHSTK